MTIQTRGVGVLRRAASGHRLTQAAWWVAATGLLAVPGQAQTGRVVAATFEPGAAGVIVGGAVAGVVRPAAPVSGVERVTFGFVAAGAAGSGPCVADFAAPAGELDVFDVFGFFDAFASGDVRANFAEPADRLDVFDIFGYFAAFAAGCP